MLITKFPVKIHQYLEGINKCKVWFKNERGTIAQKNLVFSRHFMVTDNE